MDILKVNNNGYIQIPKGYHLVVTNFGSTKLVKDTPIFDKGDVVQYNNFICIVDYTDNEGCIHYSVGVNLPAQQISYNSSCSVAEYNYTLVIDSKIESMIKAIEKLQHNL